MNYMLLIVIAVAGLAACRKQTPQVEEKVDNAATRYVGGLQADVQKAEAAAAKATQNIRTTQQGVNQAADAQ